MAKKKRKDKIRERIKKRRRQEREEKRGYVRYKCLECGIEEEIPKDVVEMFDILDSGDISVPPRFDCVECGGIMEPIKYKGVHGITYRLE